MSQFCPQCGTKNLDEAKFCKNCGLNLSEAAEQLKHEQMNNQANKAADNSKSQQNNTASNNSSSSKQSNQSDFDQYVDRRSEEIKMALKGEIDNYPSQPSQWSPWLLVVFPVVWVIMDLVITNKGNVMPETIGKAFGAAITLSLFSLVITLISFIIQKLQGLIYINFVKDTVMAMIAMTILSLFAMYHENKEDTTSLPTEKSEHISDTASTSSEE